MNAVMDKLPQLVAEELEQANALHAPFASAHEGYAVLIEEAEEAADELDSMKLGLEMLWNSIRHDKSCDVQRGHARTIERVAVRLAAEAIQVAAMARKFTEVHG